MDVRAELHRTRRALGAIWAERLGRDYDAIVFTYRLRLRRPVLRVVDLGKRWGLWDPQSRTLSLSTTLIETYDWEIVLEILKHEMAHQIVSEVFFSDDAHGSDFQRACAKLGMADWARRAESELACPIHHWKEIASEESNERLLRRAEKLLALATSSNEHEAALAMQRVQEMYSKYNLDRLRTRRPPEMVWLTLNFRCQ